MNLVKTFIILILGTGLGLLLGWQWFTGHDSTSPSAENEKKPLYWVAPMDSNYRRDGPGKSPMGMDLIPVYAEDDSSNEVGTVTISPAVVNNLGVRTAKVSVEPMVTRIKTVGYVQYDEDKLMHIHPRVEGWVETLYVKAAGDPVVADTPLYTLYSPALVNAQEEFLIAVNRGNQALINAARERLLALQLAPSFIDELAKRKQVKQSITFYAPQSGVLDDLQIREGFYVKPGNTLMSIGQLDQVWVEAEVFERDANQVKIGQHVSMTLDYLPSRTWHGRVDYIYPSLDVKTRTLRVRLRFDNQDHALKPNMFASVILDAEASAATLQVAKEAVIRTGKQDRVVLALGDGKFKSVAVKLGRIGEDMIEILEGLNADDQVVTSAQFLIDSESSKTSDFKRMSDQTSNSVWVAGRVNQVDIANRSVNLDHDPVADWNWPAMTMDFNVADSVDMTPLAAGQSLHFQIEKSADGSILLTGIHIMDKPATMPVQDAPSATVKGVIEQINSDTRILTISREAIEKWQRPAATMDFIAADTLDLTALKQGMEIEFTFVVQDDLLITAITPLMAHH
ncbi:efflux RND transporter periplasmic adaptor subunit [Pseudoalteromonas fenneropenaei]|uniref:Efflux RND transporter periplasmic adaptor subunit n=1 Tax=Pseudoalteromonas fenneropenaei TaxID=1737459 RepID=A0ABV7CG39_9GAMM